MKREITEFEYHPYDPQARFDFFHEAYQIVSGIDIPTPPNAEDDEISEVPDDEYWLEAAAYHAQIALMDALAGLVDAASNKLPEDDEGVVWDDEA